MKANNLDNFQIRKVKIQVKIVCFYPSISLDSFKLRPVLSNLNRNFPTSVFKTENFLACRFFQQPFPTTRIPYQGSADAIYDLEIRICNFRQFNFGHF